MGNVIRNRWVEDTDAPLVRARIMRGHEVPEGVDVERVRATGAARVPLDPGYGHLLSVIEGAGRAIVDGEPLALGAGVHLFVPPETVVPVEVEAGASLVHVATPGARGRRVLLRDEAFVSACAIEGQALRWTLTPQYLSRRVFLHHDPVLLSKSGHPLSWFHTTMFDVAGLPPNADGESVFKMSYNSRTELNVCYDVRGEARVRMADHPYSGTPRTGLTGTSGAVSGAVQSWGAWQALDGDATYHLDEAAGGPHEERLVDPVTGAARTLRNKHEVYSSDGYVSLYCLFDPAPTGVERHRPGEYSDYEPFEAVAVRDEYRAHQREIARLDAMVDRLSLARARGRLDAERGGEAWDVYQRGREAQRALEAALVAALAAEGLGRDAVVERWRSTLEL